MIREYVTINPGTAGGGSKTVIGNNCLFMIFISCCSRLYYWKQCYYS